MYENDYLKCATKGCRNLILKSNDLIICDKCSNKKILEIEPLKIKGLFV